MIKNKEIERERDSESGEGDARNAEIAGRYGFNL